MPGLRLSGRSLRHAPARARARPFPAAPAALSLAVTAVMAVMAAAASPAAAQEGPPDMPVSACSICDEELLKGKSGGVSYWEVAAQACWIARKLSCDGRSGAAEGCWARSVTDALLDGSRMVATGAPPFLACDALGPDPGGGRPRRCLQSPMAAPGPLLAPAALIVALVGVVILGKAMLGVGQAGISAAWWHLFRAAVAWTMISYLAYSPAGRTGAEALWDLFGALMSLGAGAGALIVDALQKVPEGSPDCSPLEAGTGWDGFRLSLEHYLDRLLEIMAAVAVVGRTLIPSALGTGTDLMSFFLEFNPSVVLVFLRFMFASFLAMAAISLVTAFSISVAETVLTTAAILGLSPLLAVLWIFSPTRASLVSAVAGVAHAAITMVVAGITIALAITLTELSMRTFVDRVTNHELVETAESERGCTVSDRPGLRGEIQRYLDLVACSDDEKSLTKTEGNLDSWIPALLLFIAGIVTAKAVLSTASAMSAELTSSRNVSGKISDRIHGMAKEQAGKASGLVRGIGGR